jgi:hypothetical protein
MPLHARAAALLVLLAASSPLACSGDTAAAVDGGAGPQPGGDGGTLPGEPAVGCVDSATDGALQIPAVYERRTVANAAARNAICNDGSPAVYYVRRGAGCGAKRWIVALEGGGSCNTVDECRARAVALKSSKNAPDTMTFGGILSEDPKINPDFFSANAAFINYCSSDNWVGERPASAASDGLAFRGHDIFQAVLEDLEQSALTGATPLKDSAELLLVGSSAGGLGVLGNADALAARYPALRVRALADAGWVANINSFGSATQPPAPSSSEFDARFVYWNATPDASCAAAEKPLGRCGVAPILFPYLKTPLFVHQDQSDPVQLKMLGAPKANTSPEAATYATNFATAIRTSLAVTSGAFSPNAGDHGIVFKPEFATRTLKGATLRETLGAWYFDRSGAKKAIE